MCEVNVPTLRIKLYNTNDFNAAKANKKNAQTLYEIRKSAAVNVV